MKKSKILLLLFTIGLFFQSCDIEEMVLSNEKEILSFRFQELDQVVDANIDKSTKQISAMVPPGTELNQLVPTITVSANATVDPPSHMEMDFREPVVYTVTAQNKSTAQYTVNVSVDPTGPETLRGQINQSRTLEKRNDHIDYIIDGELSVGDNAVLTIDPGVKIAFSGIHSGITVGENAALKIAGTFAEPVILTGPVGNNSKGSWTGLRYFSSRMDNLIQFAEIINAGNQVNDAAIYLVTEAAVNINNTIISGSVRNGIVNWGGRIREFSNNVIADCNDAPLYTYSLGTILSLDSSNEFINNGTQAVIVEYADLYTNDITLNRLQIPYLFNHGIALDRTLTVEKGTQMLFNGNTEFNIYDNGRLIANGDEMNPILISSIVNEKGFWKGIIISSTRDNQMNHCIVSNAGSFQYWTNAGIYMHGGSRLTIKNTSISSSLTYGFAFNPATVIIHENVSFFDCDLGNVYDVENDEILDTLP